MKALLKNYTLKMNLSIIEYFCFFENNLINTLSMSLQNKIKQIGKMPIANTILYFIAIVKSKFIKQEKHLVTPQQGHKNP